MNRQPGTLTNAKQIIWSLRAQDDRRQIFDYWTQRNKSSNYSKKLNKLFRMAVKLIVKWTEPTEVLHRFSGLPEIEIHAEDENRFFFEDFNTELLFHKDKLTIHEHGQDSK